VEKAGIVQAPIGKASFTPDQLQENFNALLDALVKAKPSASKGRYFKRIALSTTMGPSVKVDPIRAQAVASGKP